MYLSLFVQTLEKPSYQHNCGKLSKNYVHLQSLLVITVGIYVGGQDPRFYPFANGLSEFMFEVCY